MGPHRNSMLQRYLVACVAASLATIAILFVMTQLISPIGGDPVVRRMLLQLDFQRRHAPVVPGRIRAIELPPKPAIQPAPDRSRDEDDRPERVAYGQEPAEATNDTLIDWWAEAEAVIEDLDDAEFDDWLESRGYRKWVSVMQGPMPTSGGPAMSPEEERSGYSYKNVYGELEFPISQNCVMQVPSRPSDSSDFARNIPPRIVCKETKNMDLSGLGEYLERGGNQ